MKTIPLAEPWIGKELGDAVGKQVASGFLGPGPTTRDFGQALADLAGVPYCVPTVSGTMAITIAAQALECLLAAEALGRLERVVRGRGGWGRSGRGD